MPPRLAFGFPEGRRFAFTVFDDTDVATLDSIRPLYDLLSDLGLRTTKTVWSFPYAGPSSYAGSHTLANAGYAAYMRELAGRGFEIAYHGASMESSTRDIQERALARFREVIGVSPRTFASHAQNRDNLYWGEHRFGSMLTRIAYRRLSGDSREHFQGHVKGSPYFWGDLALEQFDYVRGFTFAGLDLCSVTPHLCYRDERTPWVKHWFSSNDADNVEEFVQLMSEANQDALEASGGVAIVSTHLGKGFVSGGRVDPRIERLLRRLAAKGGWFVPVATLLDHLRASGLEQRISAAQRLALELRWFADARVRRAQRREYRKSELEYLERGRDDGGASAADG